MSNTLKISKAILETKGSLRIRQAAKAAILSDESYLLVMERHADGTPFWTFPGGGVNENESLEEGLRREIREEIDCQVVIGDRTGTVWYAHTTRARTISAYTAFECSIISEPEPNSEEGIFEYRWARPEEFPPRTIPQIRLLSGR